MRRKPLTVLILTIALLASCGWTPLKEVRPRADYIVAGVQVGDSVEIESADGRRHKFEVVDVTPTAVVGSNVSIAIADITSIGVRTWKEIPHPCGAGRPVGCSIPEVVIAMSEDYADQAKKFHPACVTHDFCYRHGAATYGLDRSACDDQFYEDMKKACGGTGMLGTLDVSQYGICQLAALQTYEAVRRYGESAFLSTTSSYCDYR